MIFRAIDDVAAGRDPPLTGGADTISGPSAIDAVGPVVGRDKYWQSLEAERRTPRPGSPSQRKLA